MPIVKLDDQAVVVELQDNSEIIIQTVPNHDIGNLFIFTHASALGLTEDDHPQYHTDTRGDARYVRTSHLSDTGNPHETTKAHVGLANVDNTADLVKPISADVQAALDNKIDVSTPGSTIINITVDTTVDIGKTYLVDATTADILITLPTSVGLEGMAVRIKRIDNSFNIVTVATSLSETIDGVSDGTLNSMDSLWVISDDNNWYIV